MEQDWADMESEEDENEEIDDETEEIKPKPQKVTVNKQIPSNSLSEDKFNLILKNVPQSMTNRDIISALRDWTVAVQTRFEDDYGRNVILNLVQRGGKPSIDDINSRNLIFGGQEIQIALFEGRINRNNSKRRAVSNSNNDRNRNGRNGRNDYSNDYHGRDQYSNERNNRNKFSDDFDNRDKGRNSSNQHTHSRKNSELTASSPKKVLEEFKISERPPEKRLNLKPPSPSVISPGALVTSDRDKIFGGAKPRELNLSSHLTPPESRSPVIIPTSNSIPSPCPPLISETTVLPHPVITPPAPTDTTDQIILKLPTTTLDSKPKPQRETKQHYKNYNQPKTPPTKNISSQPLTPQPEKPIRTTKPLTPQPRQTIESSPTSSDSYEVPHFQQPSPHFQTISSEKLNHTFSSRGRKIPKVVSSRGGRKSSFEDERTVQINKNKHY